MDNQDKPSLVPIPNNSVTSITLNQKRFLIVWCCFHLFALIVNLVPIQGEMSSTTPQTNYYNVSGNVTTVTYLFTDGYDRTNGFWPFVQYTPRIYYPLGVNSSFNGIFAGYDVSEFITYIILGLAIVFLPKIWNDNKGTH